MQVTIYSWDEMEKATKLNGSQLTEFLNQEGIKPSFKRNEDNMLFFEKPKITKAKQLTKEHREKVAIHDANARGMFTLNQMYAIVRNQYFDIPLVFFRRCLQKRGIKADDIIQFRKMGVYKKKRLKSMIDAVAYGLVHRKNLPIVQINASQFEFLRQFIYSKEEFIHTFKLDPKKVDEVWDSVRPRPLFIYKNLPYYKAEKMLDIKEKYFDTKPNRTQDGEIITNSFF